MILREEIQSMHLINAALADIPFRCLSNLGVVLEAVSGRSYAGPPVAKSHLTPSPD